ncbi:sugar ABC transporter ATP-binding protein [Planosporangium thailandense]|uniref:Sugar ABC transporter ATP-binding protein n=1 Tax=Planosporangium thailandense TaxID=765197 RepID=A0ABX0Y3R9_9ACTN|nr:sugar ABC transporter ATP-binding protein [Planosporangium thailandense]NJC71974.1 sugar ABC transporter ATP-binding protein [Planosporangium thailandense]
MTLQMVGIEKSYSGFRVLRGVDLSVAPGEVHALLGPNGAGKSTLIKCIAGAINPEAGSIRLDDAPVEDLTPTRAFELGIAVIHQHLSLVDVLSVTDNLFMGHELRRGPLINRRAQRRVARELLDQFGIDVPLDAKVGTLPIGTKQLLEIAKAWHRTDVKVIVLDEPTASLSESETQRLFAEVARMKQRGARIIYTTHRLGEVFRIADRVTVLRDGMVTLQEPVASLVPQRLVAAISGGNEEAAGKRTATAGEVVLDVDQLAGPRFGPVSLQARRGEILGLYGVLGSGRTSLLETLAGRFRPSAGQVTVNGTRVAVTSPARVQRAGVALVPSDRQRQALWATRSASDNLLLPSFGRLAAGALRRPGRERGLFQRTATALDLQPPDARRAGGAFSGGNQQKLVLGRWLARIDELSVLLLDEPTQGVDVGARRKIYDVCRELTERGVAVVFASTDADEVAALADRALVIDAGRVIAELAGDEITEKSLLDHAHQFTGVTA